MRAGQLDRRVTFERVSTIKNEFNEDVETWLAFVTVWARRRDGSDVVKTEILGAEQVGAFLLAHFTVRHSAQIKTVTPIDRIKHDGHLWNIKGTKETAEGRNRFIEITAVRANN